MKSNLYAASRRFAATLVGIVFFCAGMLKLMDPVGAGLKVGDYLTFFHIGFLSAFSEVIAFALSFTETVCGAALCAGVFRKPAAIISSALTLLFTNITFILLVSKTNMDCGCFGEAIKMTPAQTFAKNVVLCVLCAYAYIPFNDMEEPRKIKYLPFALAVACALGLSTHATEHLPLIDFTEFAPGYKFISSAQASSDDADEGSVLSLISRNGWAFDNYFQDGSDLIVSVPYPQEMKFSDWARANIVLEDAAAAGLHPVLLVAGNDNSLIPDAVSIAPYSADPRKLIALNRFNGGITISSEGTIVKKYAPKCPPTVRELEDIQKECGEAYASEDIIFPGAVFQTMVVIPLALMILL